MPKTNGKLQTLHDESGSAYFIQMRWDMLYDAQLTMQDILLYAILQDRYRAVMNSEKVRIGHGGIVLFPSRQWLVDRSGGRLSMRGITRSIAALSDRKWLKVIRVAGKSNHYSICVPTRVTMARVP